MYKINTLINGQTNLRYCIFEQSLRRDYVGALSLEDGGIEKFRHEAGWTDSKGREVAAVYDHRGSLRATWTKPRNTNSGLIPGGSISLLPSKVFDNLTAYYPYGLPFADWQGDDRYLYCGKELEREFGMLTYDYHARGYNPALALFDRPDPCATKFPHVFSYLYCNANPISYTDPTGCILKMANQESWETQQKIHNKLFNQEYFNFSMNNDGIIDCEVTPPKKPAKGASKAERNMWKTEKEQYKKQYEVYQGIKELMDREDTYTVQFTDPNFEVGGDKMSNIMGCYDDENKNIYICKDLNIDIKVDGAYSNNSNKGFYTTKVSITTESSYFHEIMEAIIGNNPIRYQVIDYDNLARVQLGLNMRPYDRSHSHFPVYIKNNQTLFYDKYNK